MGEKVGHNPNEEVPTSESLIPISALTVVLAFREIDHSPRKSRLAVASTLLNHLSWIIPPEELEVATRRVTDRELFVLEQRLAGRKLREIGASLQNLSYDERTGVNTERVRQIEAKAKRIININLAHLSLPTLSGLGNRICAKEIIDSLLKPPFLTNFTTQPAPREIWQVAKTLAEDPVKRVVVQDALTLTADTSPSCDQLVRAYYSFSRQVLLPLSQGKPMAEEWQRMLNF